MSQLESPHIAKVFEFQAFESSRHIDNSAFFSLELIEGGSIKSLVTEKGTLSIEEAIYYMNQLMRGKIKG